MNFGDCLKSILDDREISQREFARQLNIAPTTLNGYIRNTRQPDFELVKIPDSTLTTVNTEFKGYFNDPALVVEGFNTYGIVHETYALTRVIYFVMTGKTNTEKIANQNLRAFVERGLNPDKTKRFQNIRDMISAFKTI